MPASGSGTSIIMPKRRPRSRPPPPAFPTAAGRSWTRNLSGPRLSRRQQAGDRGAHPARQLSGQSARASAPPTASIYLGQALTRLNRRTEACRVYDELARVYPNVRDQIRSQLPQARRAARCAAT